MEAVDSVAFNSESLKFLRHLRAWHWRHVEDNRKMSQRCAIATTAQRYAKEADFHVKAVQHLNEFFPMSETAAHDVERGIGVER